jgi:hypothetical protein
LKVGNTIILPKLFTLPLPLKQVLLWSVFVNFLKLNKEVQKEFELIIKEKSGHSPAWFSIARTVTKIKADVLFVQDKNDNMTPYSDVEPLIKANHSNFRFILTEGLGHRRIYRDSKVAKAILDFF